MKMEYWHNPRCSKSRQTLEMLRAKGVEPKIVEYLINPPTEQNIRDAARKLGVPPRDMMRIRDDLYKELNLANEDDDALFAAMAAHPALIERPIAITETEAVIGRPPENILRLLEK